MIVSHGEIQSERLPNGMRFRLPKRELGKLRWAGLPFILFGFFFSGFAIFWMAMASKGMRSQQGEFEWFGLAFTLFGLPFVYAGFKIMSVGFLILGGKSIVDLDRGFLKVVENVGPFSMRKKIPLDAIAQLTVVSVGAGIAEKLEGLASLRAERINQPPLELLRGYPKAVLENLADKLRSQWNETDSLRGPATKPKVRTEEIKESPPIHDLSERYDPPVGTKIKWEQTPKQLSFALPPPGMKGSYGLLGIGIVWCLIILIISIFAIVVVDKKQSVGDILVALAVMGLFGMIGVAMILGGLNLARRKALIIATPNELKLAEQSLFRSRSFNWRKEELISIWVGPSGLEVNNRPVLNLQIHFQNGKKSGFFGGRDLEELRWMASHLRKILNLAPPGP